MLSGDLLKVILLVTEIVVAVSLVTSILLQQRGSGLGGAFGAGSSGGIYYQKRGAEKFLFYATIVLSFIFLTIAIILVRI